MVMGCTSDAGKSFLAAVLCRLLANRDVRVAPFKAQNMSNNAAVTPDGLEMGRAQYLQALAARAVPQARMNPVLLKPSADTYSQVIVMGRYDPEITALPWLARKDRLWPVVQAALHSLLADYEQVVIEGAGSPAEVNLRASDIVNMAVALECRADVYLAADIDRGGAFLRICWGPGTACRPRSRRWSAALCSTSSAATRPCWATGWTGCRRARACRRWRSCPWCATGCRRRTHSTIAARLRPGTLTWRSSPIPTPATWTSSIH